MKIICVIPARAGSKGIKNKNIVKLNNKKLIEYTFSAVKKSKINESYILSDSLKIINLAKKYKINTDYKRPSKTSGDNDSLIKTLKHFMNWLKKNKINFDYMLILQPTSPLRTYKDINKCYEILKKNKPLSLFSVSPSLEHPFESIKILPKNTWNYIIKRPSKVFRRQQFNIESYFENGAIYASHVKILKKDKIFSKSQHICYLMSKINSLDINDKEDLKLCESIMRNRK